MYAVIRTGGKQYRVSKGDVLRVEKIAAEQGGTVEFDEVLMVGEGKDVTIGKPLVNGSSVKAKVRELVRGDKVEIIKFKRRKHHMRRQGHRQDYVEVEITDIIGGKGGSKAAQPKAEAAAAKPKAAATSKSGTAGSAAKAGAEAPKKASAAKKTAAASKPGAAAKSATAKKPAAKSATATKKSAGKATTAKKSTAAAKKPAAKKSTKSDK